MLAVDLSVSDDDQKEPIAAFLCVPSAGCLQSECESLSRPWLNLRVRDQMGRVPELGAWKQKLPESHEARGGGLVLHFKRRQERPHKGAV